MSERCMVDNQVSHKEEKAINSLSIKDKTIIEESNCHSE